MKKILLIVVVISLSANLWLVWKNTNLTKEQEAAASTATRANPKVLIDTKNFDFSGTTLSDKAWEIPEPDKTPPLKPDEAPVINAFDPKPAQ